MNKTILITGSTSGIGEAVARNFLKKGYHLILIYRKKSKIKKWQKLLFYTILGGYLIITDLKK